MEKSILQKIWAEQDFLSESLITDGGQKISVDFAGSLNVSGDGPAFRNAQLIIDGELRKGDIDVHIKQQGLIRHSYQAECNYNRVILEVCLFPNPDPKRPDYKKENKKLIPTLFLLPHLFRGIEEYAENYAVEMLSGRYDLMEKDIRRLRNLSNEEINDLAASRIVSC